MSYLWNVKFPILPFCLWKAFLFSLNPIRQYNRINLVPIVPFLSLSYSIKLRWTYCCSIVVSILSRTKNFTVFPHIRWLYHWFLALFLYPTKAIITTDSAGIGISYLCITKFHEIKLTILQMPLPYTWDAVKKKHMRLFSFVDSSSRVPHTFWVYSFSPRIRFHCQGLRANPFFFQWLAQVFLQSFNMKTLSEKDRKEDEIIN